MGHSNIYTILFGTLIVSGTGCLIASPVLLGTGISNAILEEKFNKFVNKQTMELNDTLKSCLDENFKDFKISGFSLDATNNNLIVNLNDDRNLKINSNVDICDVYNQYQNLYENKIFDNEHSKFPSFDVVKAKKIDKQRRTEVADVMDDLKKVMRNAREIIEL